MASSPRALGYVYEGWEGYNRSLVNAISNLSEEQLAFKSCPDMRGVGELAWHIADGRVDWFQRINPEPCKPLRAEIESREGTPLSSAQIVAWFSKTWQMVEATLALWTVDDLPVTFEQPYQGKVFAVSRQWVIWRIMAHDIHHGGQLSEMLAIQGVFPTELTWLGGHLTEPPVVREA